MSVCGQSGPTEDDSGSEEVTAATAGVRDLYKQKPASKVVRVLTVLAYLLSVSLAAILLSVYYVCVWKSPELPPLNDTEAGLLAARRGSPADYAPVAASHSAIGGGDSAVNVVPPTPIPITNSLENASSTEETTYSTDSTTLTEPLYNSSYLSTEDLNSTMTSVT